MVRVKHVRQRLGVVGAGPIVRLQARYVQSPTIVVICMRRALHARLVLNVRGAMGNVQKLQQRAIQAHVQLPPAHPPPVVPLYVRTVTQLYAAGAMASVVSRLWHARDQLEIASHVPVF
jgi:hypothetical protein